MNASKSTYAGLFMVTLATLMYEILLTRIFSVTMWYHFAFMAISVAMFGMTLGALRVYLRRETFAAGPVKYQLALSALLFGISAVVSFVVHMVIPFVPEFSLLSMGLLAVIYVVLTVPFVFSGVCVCLALTKFPEQVSKLYAADLAGAAMGCLLVIATLKVSDAPTAIFVAALLASIGAILLAADAGATRLAQAAVATSLLLAAFVAVNTVRVKRQEPLLRLTWVRGRIDSPSLFEKWNSFSRIAIKDYPRLREVPFGWGLSPAYQAKGKVSQLFLLIDANAGTVLTRFDGETNSLEHLKYDVTNLAHYIRPDSRVLVIGSGGGRDILSALAFGQRSVLAVEINEDIINAVNNRFGDFTGHLNQNPKVTFVNDEARSYVARSKEQFDIIQASLIDTWAATAAGAFVLSENSLYTIEAWKVLLSHLSPNGVLTFSRWYVQDLPAQMYRLTALASASLMRIGIEDPDKHIVIVRCMKTLPQEGAEGLIGVGTVLVSKTPFSDRDLDTIDEITRKMQFDPVFSTRFAADSTFSTIASGKNLASFTANFPTDISPPTDNRPFFFYMLRLRNPAMWLRGQLSLELKAVSVLGFLLIIVSVLTLLCIVVPLALTTRKEVLRGTLPHFVYFAGIGLGFMLVEVSQMQRLIIFLGHPTYGLSVVLFALLLSSGIGSYLTESSTRTSALGWKRLLLLLGLLVVFGALTPTAIRSFEASTTPERILVATAILFPVGLAMGMAFPLGLSLASKQSPSLTPWLWGVNGAASVCASVLAVAIALNAGISASFWCGFCCYAAACGSFVWASQRAGRLQHEYETVTR